MLPIAMFGANPMELGIILVLIVLLFGVKKLPELGKSMAEGIHEFKKAARKAQESDVEEPKPPTETPKSE